MNQLEQVNAFIDASRSVSSPVELSTLVDAFALDAGFRYYSLFQGTIGGTGVPLVISNYPEAWVERVRALRYHLDDPVFVASARTAVGFRVSDVANAAWLTRRQRRTLHESAVAGLGDGFSVPAHVPGEAHGVCTFLVAAGQTVPASRFPSLQLVGAFAYETGRRLMSHAGKRYVAGATLTDRQLECVVLIARGKSDWEIARILGIAEDTVTEYVDDARRRYDVDRRIQLVLRALVDGYLTLQDALN